MKRKIVRVAVVACLLIVFFSYSALAGFTSRASITKNQTGAWGAYGDLDSWTQTPSSESYVNNQSSSTNTLWAAGQSQTGKEYCQTSAAPGRNNSRTATDILTGRYRVVLDPQGPNYSGCNGSGSHSWHP